MNHLPKSVLAVDDDESILDSIRMILEYSGYEVTTATNGKDALNLAKRQRFTVALLDIRMADIDGTYLLGDLQKIRPDMIKIMVTGFATLDNAMRALNFGAKAYVTKPVDPKKLLDLIAAKIAEQEKTELLNEDRIGEWLEDRFNKLSE